MACVISAQVTYIDIIEKIKSKRLPVTISVAHRLQNLLMSGIRGWLAGFTFNKSTILDSQVSNEQFAPSRRPVALFLGGTSGIGQAMAEQLAKQTNGRAHIILLGRNQEAAEKIIASFPHTPDGTPSDQESKYSFIKVDATSMAEIREVTLRLSKELDKINFIVTSCAVLTLKGREETSEGIDRQMACIFYARFRFIYDLMPFVVKAEEAGERVSVMSVL